ncbi:hypothetical protein COCC4DRAFT_140573 [Bipolaris maydis ATCC 48331]|uniref:Uncharacterized protein n=2 Tax=Cochliobolus heterostrophus TaxID=5016 RepID=M2TIH3_COCH5|nr:uncharacterized protein COCC4DRAFT_140573 [Bipolaris maydis ATCC 48331]EMD97235.1 hypothetical protein COCHEDRAFT_1209093 [Bipolaris maydis C5]KAH7551401.1 hypothetical protein BM1_09717 [Bipolaris maydis]ENI04304.1 hypothetical protein COCC4DRAFT_140573 [Bipolaris maydis ATCC 48331]KAJ5029674.1 hypothetical protein J3E73DRAFT_254743 [Bipolaris maydis]KAJ5061573.1 hypothetical protein J3E74DRAFT_404853 [Bipolaris maydis]
MSRNFLDLPAEMRSLICEYALTENHGLCYETSGGIGRLRVRDRGEFERSEGDDNSETDALDNVSNHEVKEEVPVPQVFPVNQLQLVCQQLYRETTGLEMRYNTIFFANGEDNGTRAPQQCAEFLRRLPAKQAKHMRIKVLNTENICNQNTQAISDLVLFCKHYPDSRLDIHFETIYCSPWQYLTGAMFVDIIFDKDMLSICDLKLNELVVLPSQANSSSNSDILIGWSFIETPDNLRLFPSFESFNEDYFRESTEILAEGVSFSVDEYVAWAKNWHQHGA